MSCSDTLTLLAPAKINLFLHVCGRRDDGYHNLQTVFQFLTLADTLRVEKRQDGVIQLMNPIADIAPEQNLIYRAATLLQQHSHSRYGANIYLDKKIPMGAGLGGGSSNAASTLMALNRLWALNYTSDTLQQLAVNLGADVPIFIYGKSAWAEGIGEKLTPISPAQRWILLVVPACHVSTKEIFSHPQLTRDSKILKMATFLELGSQEQFRNDCEALVTKLYPEVNHALMLLNNFAKARMTGTGACVFALFDTEQQASYVAQQMPKNMQVFVSKTCNVSPLY